MNIDSKLKILKKFIILSKSKLLINKIDDLLENVPRKDMFYKDKIKEYTLNLIDNIIHINNEYYNKDLILFNNISSNLMIINLLFNNKSNININYIIINNLEIIERKEYINNKYNEYMYKIFIINIIRNYEEKNNNKYNSINSNKYDIINNS